MHERPHQHPDRPEPSANLSELCARLVRLVRLIGQEANEGDGKSRNALIGQRRRTWEGDVAEVETIAVRLREELVEPGPLLNTLGRLSLWLDEASPTSSLKCDAHEQFTVQVNGEAIYDELRSQVQVLAGAEKPAADPSPADEPILGAAARDVLQAMVELKAVSQDDRRPRKTILEQAGITAGYEAVFRELKDAKYIETVNRGAAGGTYLTLLGAQRAARLSAGS